MGLPCERTWKKTDVLVVRVGIRLQPGIDDPMPILRVDSCFIPKHMRSALRPKHIVHFSRYRSEEDLVRLELPHGDDFVNAVADCHDEVVRRVSRLLLGEGTHDNSNHVFLVEAFHRQIFHGGRKRPPTQPNLVATILVQILVALGSDIAFLDCGR